MSNVMDISRNQEMVRNQMLELKELLLPLCRVEEEQVFSQGLGSAVGATLRMHRAKYTRTHNRSQESDMGRLYYDALELMRDAFIRVFWIEQVRLDALERFTDIHGVSMTGNRTERRGERIISQEITFVCDWRQDLGFNMVVKIKMKLSGTHPHEMIVDYVRENDIT